MKIIKTEILGLSTGNTTHGHRFHAPGAITINTPESYEKTLLEQGKVIPGVAQRIQKVRDAANNALAAIENIGC